MQNGRNTSRSQEINVNFLNEELSFSERTARLVEQMEIKYVNLNSTSLTVE